MVAGNYRPASRAAIAATSIYLVLAVVACERLAGLNGVTDGRVRPSLGGAPTGGGIGGGDVPSPVEDVQGGSAGAMGVEAGGGGAEAGGAGTGGNGESGVAGAPVIEVPDGEPSCTLGISSLNDCFLE